jgi:hypothetical protein
VITAKYHEHHRVFRLPGPIGRALAGRIAALNEILDVVGERHDIGVLDLGAVPGIYDPRSWAVDRLHPSELGHRLLARALAAQLAAGGTTVHREVSLECAGGRHPGRLARRHRHARAGDQQLRGAAGHRRDHRSAACSGPSP